MPNVAEAPLHTHAQTCRVRIGRRTQSALDPTRFVGKGSKKRYGLLAVENDDYDEVPDLLRKIERRVAARRVWVSGSWPIEMGGAEASNIHALAKSIGRQIGDSNRDLVTGAGLSVGSASISGFLSALRKGGGGDLDTVW